jgi:hypothetical protein
MEKKYKKNYNKATKVKIFLKRKQKILFPTL